MDFDFLSNRIVENFHQLNLVNIVVNFLWRCNITESPLATGKKFCPKVLQYFLMNQALTMETTGHQLFVKDQEEPLVQEINLHALLVPC